MIKPVSVGHEDTICMGDMKPLQIGVIVDNMSNGHVVMRTASKGRVEIMDLTQPGADGCWDGHCTLRVRLLWPGTKIVLEVTE